MVTLVTERRQLLTSSMKVVIKKNVICLAQIFNETKLHSMKSNQEYYLKQVFYLTNMCLK